MLIEAGKDKTLANLALSLNLFLYSKRPFASSKSKRNGVREASDKSFKIFKRERVVTPLPF
jgi:hypothetical protein